MIRMTRRFLIVTVCLTAMVSFLVGLVVAGSLAPATATSMPSTPAISFPALQVPPPPVSVAPSGLVSFADIAERLNPAVVNVDATTRGESGFRRHSAMPLPDRPDMFGRPDERERDEPRKGTGSGFVIDKNGYILTNHHVIDGADRVSVRLLDGRTLRAETIGSDPDTDIALIKVSASTPLTSAPLGNSDQLRVGEWVCAIGNPLAYEHTVTVGVVSFIGRKLFDTSLDHYIQTDAAINFGNSGGPLINIRGEVVGINAAISSRASSIGFAVPINQAREILPQLREKGRVSRGYIGVTLKDIDQDLQRSLRLTMARGALVQDVAAGSPGARAGMRAYDVIVAVDGKGVTTNDALIQDIAGRRPGSVASLQIVRDGRALTLPIRLSERPPRDRGAGHDVETLPEPTRRAPALGLLVREMDSDFAARFRIPDDARGVIVSRVEPMSPAFDAEIERGSVVLEVNRHAVRSIDEYRRATAGAHKGDVLAFYIYSPELKQRRLQTVRVEEQ
jgi:serine protease Do